MIKVLFLDIDGVINRFKFKTDGGLDNTLDEGCIEQLRRIVEETRCSIVISSSWKVSNSLLDVLEEELFPKLPRGCVIGCTPTKIPQVHREIEIQEYLDRNHNIENYVIIDDYDFELKSFLDGGHCVITDALKGLTEKDADKAIEILND